jgi:hypothetical protein
MITANPIIYQHLVQEERVSAHQRVNVRLLFSRDLLDLERNAVGKALCLVSQDLGLESGHFPDAGHVPSLPERSTCLLSHSEV